MYMCFARIEPPSKNVKISNKIKLILNIYATSNFHNVGTIYLFFYLRNLAVKTIGFLEKNKIGQLIQFEKGNIYLQNYFRMAIFLRYS